MKIFTIILMFAAIALFVYNATIVDFSNLTAKDSSIALISMLASICAILLLLILRTSKKIEQKVKERD